MLTDIELDCREETIDPLVIDRSVFRSKSAFEVGIESKSGSAVFVVTPEQLSRIAATVGSYATGEDRKALIHALGGIPVLTEEEVANRHDHDYSPVS